MGKDNTFTQQVEEGLQWLEEENHMPRYRANWMTSSDEVILEFLDDTGAAHSFRGTFVNLEDRNIDLSYNTIYRRLPKLSQAGLVEPIGGEGKYFKITQKGRDYLDGEADLRDEPVPETDD